MTFIVCELHHNASITKKRRVSKNLTMKPNNPSQSWCLHSIAPDSAKHPSLFEILLLCMQLCLPILHPMDSSSSFLILHAFLSLHTPVPLFVQKFCCGPSTLSILSQVTSWLQLIPYPQTPFWSLPNYFYHLKAVLETLMKAHYFSNLTH